MERKRKNDRERKSKQEQRKRRGGRDEKKKKAPCQASENGDSWRPFVLITAEQHFCRY